MNAIVVDELTKSYGAVQALDGVSFAVGEGEVFGLLGPNGAGKSTTVRVLVTLTKPDGGSASVGGHDVGREPNAVRRTIGYVPQESGVDRFATGRENLALQGRIQGMGGRDLRQRIDELLELVGIADAADRVVRGYSGGMKRRLDVAMGLVHRPRVLFLDEPTTGLDPEARVAMWAEVGRLAAAGVAHDPAHDALPRGGRRARRPPRDRLARPGRRPRHTGRAEGDAARRRRAGGGRERTTSTAPRPCSRPQAADAGDGPRRPHDRRPRRGRRPRAAGPARRARQRRDPSSASRSRARRSTTSTSTTPAATSPARTARDEDRHPHLVHGRPPDPQPDARADLDRGDDRPADGLAAALRAAVQERHPPRRLRHDVVHHVPRARRSSS